MDAKNRGRYFYYLISVLFLLTGLFGINRLIIKADLPFTYTFQDSGIVSSIYYEKIIPGDIVQKVDGINIKSIFQLETILDGKNIGEDSDLQLISSNGTIFTEQVHLARYYRNFNFIIISLLVGFSFWITSVFLIKEKYGERPVIVLYWVLMLFSVATMTSPGKYSPGNDLTAYIVRAFHVSTYFLGAVTFLNFTFVFPRIRTGNYKLFIKVLYFFSVLFSLILIIVQINSIRESSSLWVIRMEMLWEITEMLLLICILSGALNLFLYYRKISDLREKYKMKWIFWGLTAGVYPFLLLWLLPGLLGFSELIPEEYLLAFMVFVPVFFAMAVVKYHVFEIDVFIKRSILYSSLTFITIVIYFTAVSATAFFANDLMQDYSNLISISLILLIAFIFNPMQNKLRNIIDRSFYREKYNFEKTVSAFTAGIKDQNTISGLSRYVIKEIEKIIPVEKIALIAVSNPESGLNVLAQNNFFNLGKILTSENMMRKINSDPVKILSQKDKTEPGIYTDTELSDELKKCDVNIVYPFLPEPKDTAGAVLLGNKLSGMRFTFRDLEILEVIITNISMALKKLQLQKKVVFEELEISRLEELNKMMSYYVSSVSHDLKTPLTSIKMFTEILKESSNIKSGNAGEYLDIIEGESDRLSRLINNVLNFAKIENGIKEYSFAKMDISECIEEVLKIMEYQFMMDNFKVDKSLQQNVFISADKDAVKEVLINLISNSIKYSPDKKNILISCMREKDSAVVKIQDEGIGISKEDLKNIFKPFIRSKDINVRNTGGAGIGLSIVKSIMDAHKGKIETESYLEKGTCFSLYFPVSKDNF